MPESEETPTGVELASHWAGDKPLSNTLLHALIARHAPVIHFHPEEAYFPSSVEWYLDRANLIHGATGQPLIWHPSLAQLPTDAADPANPERLWLSFDEKLAGPALEPHIAPQDDPRRGDPDHAPAYVRAVHLPDQGVTDLQFWMFYPYDGPGLARVRPVELGATRADQVLSLWPGGMHEADWELAVIRIDHATLEPCGVILSQHRDGDMHLGPDAMARLERDETGRIQLYSSLYGHATYAHVHERTLFYLWRPFVHIGIELGLVDRIERGRTWNLGDPLNHVLISTSWKDPVVREPSWLRFPYRWGAYAPKGGRFSRQLVDGAKALMEGRMATTVFLLHLVTLGLTAILFALAPLLLGGGAGARLMGTVADNSGPVGPMWQPDKWNGNYGFSGPPQPVDWRKDGPAWARRLTGFSNALFHPPLRVVSALLGLIFAPILPKS
ncbi:MULTISPECIES: Vps62-related protein [unclassified Novosphingobium]|uniref:Vps62-related protein n=1 Tax=unclassified Novosphingobium TaxID=2644732 RepID=UPI0025EEDC0B|nr:MULTISPECIES: Vps62-related protein [unclassified Novosphingobium]HQV02835.1 Vps62-related protein [Novosphingobium sp.]